jgi:N-methylhydantoinase A
LRARFGADHIDEERIAFVRRGDLRYVGQGYELHVPFPDGEITREALAAVWQAFHAAHTAEYGQAFDSSAIEIVNARVIGTGRIDKLAGLSMRRGGTLQDAQVKVAPCLFRLDGQLSSFDTAFYRREKLPAGVSIPAPAIVLQVDSTTIVPPGAAAVTDEAGNIIITLGGAS